VGVTGLPALVRQSGRGNFGNR